MSEQLPGTSRADEDMQGHWLLAKLGKRVLRPGGRELTERLLGLAGVPNVDVVELAPGLGRTAASILELGPASYTGVDSDPDAVAAVRRVVGSATQLVEADAAETGLGGESADLVIGEAMLTMQGEKTKNAIVAEAARILRPGGRYAIHELGLVPEDLSEDIKTEIRRGLARAIKVNARPLTLTEWAEVLEANGFQVIKVDTAPMALLQPRRIIADEGIVGALRFVKNLLLNLDARKRVLQMHRTFNTYRDHLNAVAIVVTKK